VGSQRIRSEDKAEPGAEGGLQHRHFYGVMVSRFGDLTSGREARDRPLRIRTSSSGFLPVLTR